MVKKKKKINKKQLAMGMKVEKEHCDVTKCKKKPTKMIAEAHLKELPDYYTRLSKMEKAGKKALKKKVKK